ncbi:hypothetical protein [Roseomonas chloroacetimidivorans]|uniref:hypothetical protein n=1 Tax=Roseomonas chloroacetimidivorans TaxID=1766656 RepID=UPI003C740C6E
MPAARAEPALGGVSATRRQRGAACPGALIPAGTRALLDRSYHRFPEAPLHRHFVAVLPPPHAQYPGRVAARMVVLLPADRVWPDERTLDMAGAVLRRGRPVLVGFMSHASARDFRRFLLAKAGRA